MSTTSEKVTWTQFMSLQGNSITYGVDNGQSTTWGKFGQGNGLLNVSFPTTLTSFSNYQPDVSIAHSGATWQSNHVTNLSLLEVRYYAAGQLIATDSSRRECYLAP